MAGRQFSMIKVLENYKITKIILVFMVLFSFHTNHNTIEYQLGINIILKHVWTFSFLFR